MRSMILSAELRDLEPDARFILQGAHDLMREARQSVLRTGDHPTDRPGLAAKLGMDVGRLEAHLPALLVRCLLVEEPDGALSSPFLAAQEQRRRDLADCRRDREDRRRDREERIARGEEVPTLRAAASRANGARGGRRPLGEGSREAPEAAPQSTARFEGRNLGHVLGSDLGNLGHVLGSDPGNLGHVLGSDPGNLERHLGSDLGFPFKTQRGFSSASALAKAEAKLSPKALEKKDVLEESARAGASAGESDGNLVSIRENLDSKPRSEIQHGEDIDVVALARELRETSGIPAAPTNPDLSTVRGWLAKGLTPTTIRDVVRATKPTPEKPIRHLGYFRKAMAEALVTPAPTVAPGLAVPSPQPPEDRRLKPWQAGEDAETYQRRSRGLRPLVPPERETGEEDDDYRRRVERRFGTEVKTAHVYGAPAPLWEPYALQAGLGAEIAQQPGT